MIDQEEYSPKPVSRQQYLPNNKKALIIEGNGTVLVAQLVERLLPTPDICSSNPVIGKLFITNILSTVLKRRK